MKLAFSLCLALASAVAPALAVPVSVKIVGPDNQPLPGARLSWFETGFTLDEATLMRQPTGVAGVFAWEWDGDFSEKRIVGEQLFLRVRVEAPGMATQFRVISQQETTIALLPARVWGGTVFDKDKKRGAVYRGQVVGANGKPAAKAWVTVVEARGYEPIQTDEKGDFALTDVPLDKFTLMAAHDRDWTKQKAQSDSAGVTLKLNASDAAVDRAQILDKIVAIKGGVAADVLFASWDILGADGIERFIWRNGEPSAEVMALFGSQLARRDPAQLLRRAPELLDGSTGEIRENLEAQINLVRANSDDATQRADASAWLDEQKLVKRKINARSVTQLLQMAAVADKLKREDAAQWLDYAIAVAEQLGDGTLGQTQSWAAPLATLGLEAAKSVAESRNVTAEFKLWADLASAFAKAGDFEGARAALSRLETLARDPEIIKGDNPNNWETSSRRLYYARRDLLKALAPVDASAALSLAEQMRGLQQAHAMLVVADGARRIGGAANLAIAEKALREVMKGRLGDVEYYALGASIGAQINPQLGVELFALTRDKVLTDAKESMGFSASSTPSIRSWALYHAPFDPALSRVLIEREWDWRLPATRSAQENLFPSYFLALHGLIRGMSVIDHARAAEMQSAVDTLETKNYSLGMLQFNLALMKLATPEQRVALGLDFIMN